MDRVVVQVERVDTDFPIFAQGPRFQGWVSSDISPCFFIIISVKDFFLIITIYFLIGSVLRMESQSRD